MPYRIGGGIGIVIDIRIPDARNPVAFGAEMRIAPFIMRQAAIFTMLAAIDFDDQLCFVTQEVRDKTDDRHLPAKF
jgi:hypothetical protein